MLGFTNYQIDYVIKFGGSLLEDHLACEVVIKKIVDISNSGRNLLIIPGGGPTDNTIERLDKKTPFASNTHHRACARAQDQTGLMISDPAFSNDLVPCETFEEVNAAINNNKVPVLLPSKTIFAIDPFQRVWEITSDAMAAWYSWLVHCHEVIILTNVDGVFPGDKINIAGELLESINASDLIEWGHTAVDACTAPFLKLNKINAWVLNGKYPERLEMAINNEKTTGTRIWGQ